jgi:hypothetical protein
LVAGQSCPARPPASPRRGHPLRRLLGGEPGPRAQHAVQAQVRGKHGEVGGGLVLGQQAEGVGVVPGVEGDRQRVAAAEPAGVKGVEGARGGAPAGEGCLSLIVPAGATELVRAPARRREEKRVKIAMSRAGPGRARGDAAPAAGRSLPGNCSARGRSFLERCRVPNLHRPVPQGAGQAAGVGAATHAGDLAGPRQPAHFAARSNSGSVFSRTRAGFPRRGVAVVPTVIGGVVAGRWVVVAGASLASRCC